MLRYLVDVRLTDKYIGVMPGRLETQMIIVDNIWTYENGRHGILDFTVVAKCQGSDSEIRLPVRAVESVEKELKFVEPDSLESFIRQHSENPDETLAWLKRTLGFYLDFQRAPRLSHGHGF